MKTLRRRVLAGQDGFSLIEIIVGLALVSIAAALLPGSIRIAMQAWAWRSDIDRGAAMTATIEALEARLEQAMPLAVRGRDGSLSVQFAGTGTSLQFVAPGESGPEGPGLYHHYVSATPFGDDSSGLAIETAPYVPGVVAWRQLASVDRVVAVGREARFGFRYYGARPPGAKPAWHDAWQRADALPLLVEITADVPSAGRIQPRRSVIAPRIAVR